MIKACRCWLPTLMATRGRARPTSEKGKKAFSGPDWMQPPPKRKCRAEGLCAFTSEPPACFHSFSRTGRACIACKFRETSELVKYWFCNFPKYLNIWKEAVRVEKKLRLAENLDQRPRPTIVTLAFTPRLIDVVALLSYLLISSYLVDQNDDYCDICYSTNSPRIGRW